MFYNFPLSYDGVCDVQLNFDTYFSILLNKTTNLFKWEGLPDTIDENFLMTQLILTGRVCFTKFNGKLYALNGNPGGEPNVYYKPQFFIIANPVLGSKQVRIRQKDGSKEVEGLEGIFVGLTNADYIRDGGFGGLYRLIYQTAGLLSDNISSLNVSQINGRVAQLWVADNDNIARTAEEIIRDMYEGKPYRIITQEMVDKVTVLPAAQTGQSNTLLNLIEAHRSILQDFYNELGIGYQGNSKRERVNTAEIGLMRGCLDISLSSMIKNLKDRVEEINKLFETSISVDINEEVFYEGSGNATLGEEELSLNKEDTIEEGEPAQEEASTSEVEVDEKNTEKSIEVEEKKGGGDE